VSVRVTE